VLQVGEKEARAATDRLVAALADRWGPATELDLVPALRTGNPLAQAIVNDFGITSAAAWTRQGRTLCVAWSQIDADEPFEIVAAVGTFGDT
jgi:hypothetical protein